MNVFPDLAIVDVVSSINDTFPSIQKSLSISVNKLMFYLASRS